MVQDIRKRWRLQMPILYDEDFNVLERLESERYFTTREEAEMALTSASRIMTACGFNVDFNLIEESPYAEEFEKKM